jgi:RHS repeat-associated protein
MRPSLVQNPREFQTQVAGVPTTPTGYHQWHRSYAAELGRFGSRDPLGYDGSHWHLCQYASCSPTVICDPWGLWPGDPADYPACDPTGRIHDPIIPERVPRQWSCSDIDDAIAEVEKSLQCRLQQGASHGGMDRRHLSRYLKECDWLRILKAARGARCCAPIVFLFCLLDDPLGCIACDNPMSLDADQVGPILLPRERPPGTLDDIAREPLPCVPCTTPCGSPSRGRYYW